MNERKVNTQGGRQFDSAQLHYQLQTPIEIYVDRGFGLGIGKVSWTAHLPQVDREGRSYLRQGAPKNSNNCH